MSTSDKRPQHVPSSSPGQPSPKFAADTFEKIRERDRLTALIDKDAVIEHLHNRIRGLKGYITLLHKEIYELKTCKASQ